MSNNFTEFTENDINNYFNSSSSSFSSFSFLNEVNEGNEINEILFNDNFNDFDPKFRSIKILNENNSILNERQIFQYGEKNDSYLQGPIQLKREDKNILIENNLYNSPLKYDFHIETPSSSSSSAIASTTSSTIATTTISPSTSTTINTSNITVPEKPFYLGPSQFITTLCLTQLISHINQQLDQFFELSYNFFPDHCRWEIIFLRGSSRSKFELNVFRENSQSFLIEGNRLSGDSGSFHNVFQQIEGSLTESKRKQRSNRLGTMDCIPLPASEQLPMDDVIKALKPIINMASSEQLDTKAEAAKMLCDLSIQLDLQSSLCAAGGIEILMELINIDFGACNQYAMCALANLSSSRSCQEILIKGGNQFLNILFGLVSDGPYQTAEMRRECARTLANLCSNHSKKIINSVGVDSASVWIASVDSIKDERLKLHASRAKMNMEACM